MQILLIFCPYCQYGMWYWKYNLQDILNLGNITKRLLNEDNHLVTHRWQEGIDSGKDIVEEIFAMEKCE